MAAARLNRRQGFTLLEVILAIAIGAVIMVSATAFLYSMGELWGAGSNERLFKKHSRGVSRFFETAFFASASRYVEAGANAPGASAEQTAETPVYWFGWEGDESKRLQYLTFEMDTSPGALVWPDEPLPHVVCSLFFEPGDGLFLLWRSRLEKDFEEEPPRRTLISPFVTSVKYHYIDYEAENPAWEILEEPKTLPDQSYELPKRVEIVFEFHGTKISRQLALPGSLGGVPIF